MNHNVIKRTVLLIFSALFCGCAATMPQEEKKSGVEWMSIGPGAGGAFFALAIHPQNPDIIFTGTDMGCLFRTEDGGKSWKMLGAQLEGDNPGYRGSWNVVFDNKNPAIVWAAASHGVYKSTDTGKTWKMMTRSISGGPSSFFGIAIDPSDSNIIYISHGFSPRNIPPWSHGRIWKSTDSGNSWKELQCPVGPLTKENRTASYSFLEIDPKSDFVRGEGHKRVFIGGPSGFFVSENAGTSWTSIAANIPESKGDIDSLIITEDDGKSVLFAGVHPEMTDKKSGKYKGGIFRSDDSGKSWISLNVNNEKFMETIASLNSRSPGRGNFAVFLVNSPKKPERIYMGSLMGVYRSDDLGNKWVRVTDPAHEWYNFTDRDGSLAYHGLKRYGGNFGHSYLGRIDCFNNMSVSQGNPDIIAFTDNVTMTLSKDGGKTWNDVTFDYAEPFNEKKFGDRPPMQYTHKLKSRGIQDINPNRIEVDPFDPDTIFIAYADLGLRISRDGGKTWEHSTEGIVGNMNRSQTNSVTFDPGVKGRAYLNTATHGTIYVTEDSGRTYKDISITQLADRAKKQRKDKHFQGGIIIDEKSPVNNRTLYCATEFGVYKSKDGGKTWDDSSLGIEDAGRIKVLAINPSNSNMLFARSCPFSKDAANPHAGLYISKDAGRNWFRLAEKEIGAVYSLSICKNKPDVIYAVAATPGKAGYWGASRLWKSTDGGKTWNAVYGGNDTLVRTCAVNPENPNCVYIAMTAHDLNTQKPGILKSLDGGKTWKGIGGSIPISHPRNIYIYPKDPSQIYYGDHFSAFKGIDHDVKK
ncbi:MAG: hypothetical protein A2020_02315 [Lentisphaerae bacterium GWF2_45_14]|nr:MAG: hypothetical protein A2020_02315 [Lentisphaerae bacterium GWF2_45_14]